MISGASEEELEIANDIADLLLEIEKQKGTIQYLSECINEKDGLIIAYRKEIDRLNNIISETSKDIQHELSHLKANDEVSWNEEFYTNNKLDYRKLCIALLEQVVNKLKEKE